MSSKWGFSLPLKQQKSPYIALPSFTPILVHYKDTIYQNIRLDVKFQPLLIKCSDLHLADLLTDCLLFSPSDLAVSLYLNFNG